ncbi:thioredoxin-like protein [Suillus subalutaceus]|uniref:thioredoxin-like protein n=1 Tax=Suillus subalutaceus TaxID=48586 RepID=UPI001B87B7E9|nr:thioredoxin-like protein [Suillus subalutaceus]KAG1870740.1 thioredoxin-like protein [Suillus subalutaceus]
MVLKLYGFTTSTCTLRVAVVLKEKNVPFEFISVDLTKGAHKAPEFTAYQPFGQVPYIDDNGLILYESRAICRYIAAKYASQGTPLLPTDPTATALFEQAASTETSNYDPFVSGLAWELKFAMWFGGKTDEAPGNDITLADLFHLPYGSVLLGIGLDEFSSRPNVARWWKDISSRASWEAVKGGI